MRHHRKHGDSGGGGVQLGLIITPMLDMSFQLMAFFIMTYHPSALEGHIDGNLLPPTEIAKKGPKSDQKPTDLPAVDEEPVLQDALQVVVKALTRREGELLPGDPSMILLKRAENPTPVPLVEVKNDQPIQSSLPEALRKLTAELKKDGGAKDNIKIEGDGDLKHQYLLQVYDACKQAGFQNIAFVAPPREK